MSSLAAVSTDIEIYLSLGSIIGGFFDVGQNDWNDAFQQRGPIKQSKKQLLEQEQVCKYSLSLAGR